MAAGRSPSLSRSSSRLPLGSEVNQGRFVWAAEATTNRPLAAQWCRAIDAYLDEHVLPYARRFAERVLRHLLRQ